MAIEGIDRSKLQELTRHGGYLEYSKASNPIASGATPQVPLLQFPAALHAGGGSRVIPLDTSSQLACAGPASSPGLLASFVRINAGDRLPTFANATSQLFYVISGSGVTDFGPHQMPYGTGDLFTLPSGPEATHRADRDTVFYWVHDEPMLRYLGVLPSAPRFAPTLYPFSQSRRALEEAAADPLAAKRSRISVLLTHDAFPQTLTITHVLWAMLGILPVAANQLPHSHKSVALDFIIDCKPGCYTLVSERVDGQGNLIDPVQVPWEAGGAFITPPGFWHSHHNESGEVAYLMPIQDAGLHTHLRTLDIQFHRSNVV
jgi:gentisate 1,2-dioxygenase